VTGPDAVVVGSGVSGLAAACLLAGTGRRTVVLEQNSVPGGLLQRFRRKGLPLDTGFHYVGGAGEGGPLRRYLRRLGVWDRLRFRPLDAGGFDEVVLPRRRFAFPVGLPALRAALGREFPAQAGAVARFTDEIEREWAAHPLVSFRAERLEPPTPGGQTQDTVSEALTRHGVEDPDLRALLSAHTLLYGVPADRAPFEAHAIVCGSYYHSVHGLEGGGDSLVDALVKRLAELGGEVRLRASVRRIHLEEGVVGGVELEGGEQVRTPLVVSTAHPSITLDLLGESGIPARRARRLRAATNTPSAILVHGIARGIAPAASRRNWIRFREVEDAWREPPRWFREGRDPPRMVVLPGEAVPEAPGSTVFHVFCPLAAEDMDWGWAREEWSRRKAEAAKRVLALVEECVPAWSGRIEAVDVSTPHAFRHFVRSPGGSCYGAECSIDQWGPRALPARLGVEGLRIAGQSVGLPGVLGAIVTSFLAVAPELGGEPRAYSDLRGPLSGE